MTFAAGSIRIDALASHHDREAFRCGDERLDRYLRQQAGQDFRRGVASTFVATAITEPSRVIGYFTLSAASVVAAELPQDISRRLPRHPIPAALIGRLAVDQAFAGRGLGGILVADAMEKAVSTAPTVAIALMVVDPINDAARSFYAKLGFQSLSAAEPRMVMALPRR